MKIACERCEKVTDFGSVEYNIEWRLIKVFKPVSAPQNGFNWTTCMSDILLCDYCYDKLMGMIHMDETTKANPNP